MPASLAQRQEAVRRRTPVWTARTLDQHLDLAAADFPNREYVVTDSRAFTYREIKRMSEKIAGGLLEAGLRRGGHVAIVLANYPEFVAVKYAIARIGATCIPINYLNRRDELGYVLRQSDADLLLTMDRFRGLDYLTALDELAPGWETNGGGEAFPRLKKVVVFPTSGATRAGAASFAELSAASDAYEGGPDGDPHAVSDIIYTSGTTGSPKGVMLSHDMVLRAAFGSVYARAFDDAWRVVFSLPMYHVYGYIEGMLTTPFVGGAIIPQLQFEPAATLEAIERHKADDVLLVPTMTLALLDELKRRDYRLPTLRSVISSGQRSPGGIWKEIFEWMHPGRSDDRLRHDGGDRDDDDDAPRRFVRAPLDHEWAHARRRTRGRPCAWRQARRLPRRRSRQRARDGGRRSRRTDGERALRHARILQQAGSDRGGL